MLTSLPAGLVISSRATWPNWGRTTTWSLLTQLEFGNSRMWCDRSHGEGGRRATRNSANRVLAHDKSHRTIGPATQLVPPVRPPDFFGGRICLQDRPPLLGAGRWVIYLRLSCW